MTATAWQSFEAILTASVVKDNEPETELEGRAGRESRRATGRRRDRPERLSVVLRVEDRRCGRLGAGDHQRQQHKPER